MSVNRQSRGYVDDESWPVIYSITATSNRHVSVMGGMMVTIEGKNFGSVLSSFGEEDREENSDIQIFFVKTDDESVYVPCEEIAHFHNPTQLFCVMRFPFPERYSYYAARIFINGNEANLH